MDNKSSNKNSKLTMEKLRTKLTSGTGDVVVKTVQEVESFTQEEVEYLKVFKDDFLDKFWSDKRLLVYYLKTKAKEKTYDYLDLLYIEYDEKESTLEGLFRLFNDEKFVRSINLYSKDSIEGEYENTRVYNYLEYPRQVIWVKGFRGSNSKKQVLSAESCYIKTIIDSNTDRGFVVIYDKNTKEVLANFKGPMCIKHIIRFSDNDNSSKILKLLLTGYQMIKHSSQDSFTLNFTKEELAKAINFVNSLLREMCKVFPEFEREVYNRLNITYLADYDYFNLGNSLNEGLLVDNPQDIEDKFRRLAPIIKFIIEAVAYKIDNYLLGLYGDIDILV